MKVELFKGVLFASKYSNVNIDSNQSKRDCCHNLCNNQRHVRECNNSGTHTLLSVVHSSFTSTFMSFSPFTNITKFATPFLLSHSLTHSLIHSFLLSSSHERTRTHPVLTGADYSPSAEERSGHPSWWPAAHPKGNHRDPLPG
jgi:hypothetical protein